jgi:hypothetical protein
MKHIYFFALLLFLTACQNEEFFEQVEEETSLSSQSELSNLISRLNQNPTAFDDFIDNSNSLRVEFPFEVSVNSENSFSLTEVSDYQPLIDELASLTEDYNLEIEFPIEVSLPNYERLSIQNQSELDAIKATVTGSSEIGCLEYAFPLEVNGFNAGNSFISNENLQNKAQLYNYIQDLKQSGSFYEIVYPITVQIEGAPQTLTSNQDLEVAIETLDPDCFDPSLFDTNTSRLEQFIAFVTSGDFIISEFIAAEDGDLSTTYQDFRFRFNSNFIISIQNVESGESFSGTWLAEIDDNELVFELDFEENESLEELDEDWIVDAFANPSTIELRDEDEDVGEESFLIFEKI